MSGKRHRDYKKVLEALKSLLPGEPLIRGIVIYFKSAIWRPVQEIFPDADIKGSLFNWNQALWRKVQNLGLQTAYTQDQRTRKLIRKCMALPFLPHERILEQFQTLKKQVNTLSLTSFVTHMQNTWFETSAWSPSQWG